MSMIHVILIAVHIFKNEKYISMSSHHVTVIAISEATVASQRVLIYCNRVLAISSLRTTEISSYQ